MPQLKALLQKYREPIAYLFFGGLTTLCNLAVYTLCTRLLHMDPLAANILALAISILFAFFTNRRFVFQSTGKEGFWREFWSFVSLRLVSSVLDMASIAVFVTWLGLYDLAVKVVTTVAVIILNYVFSKWFIFKKTKEEC